MKNHKSILIKNIMAAALMDDSRSEIQNCGIYIEGNVIKKIGEAVLEKADIVIDARGCLAVPGFINTHHHLYQVLTRNLPAVQDKKLFDWLIYLYEIWRHLTPEAVYSSAQAGLGELLLTGCTTSSDHFYVFPKGQSGELIDEEIAAAESLGMRFHACRGSMSRGKSKGGLPPDDVVQTEDEILKDCERLVSKYHNAAPFAMCRIALAPCSPFSVTTELLKLTAEMAKKWNVRMHTHLAETLDEEEYCLQTHKTRPLRYMESAGWLEHGNAWFAHCVHMTEGESEKMGKTRTGVAHCPSSNLRLGSGIAPVRMFLNNKVPVGLGVDGSASNDSSDMLAEARQAMLIHRIKSGVDSMPARDVLWMATRGGASVLGREDIGSLEPGKAADIALFDLSGIEYAGSLADPVSALLFCGISHKAKWVIVNGKIVVEDFRLSLADEKEIAGKVNKISKALLNKVQV